MTDSNKNSKMIKVKPFSYQIPSIDHLCTQFQKWPTLVEASETGIGKTFITCFTAKKLNRTLIVICPRVVVKVWEEAAQVVGNRVLFITNYEQTKTAKFKYGGWVRNTKKYQWNLPPDPHGYLIAFDECHKLNGKKSQIGAVIRSMRQLNDDNPDFIKFLLVSATMAKDPTDMMNTGYLLGFHNGKSDFWSWCIGLGVIKGKFGLTFPPSKSNLQRLHKMIFPERGNRVKREDIPDFPDNQIDVKLLPGKLSTKTHALLDKIDEKQALDPVAGRLAELLGVDASDDMPVVSRLRDRQRAEILKIEHIVDMTKEFLREDKAVVVFVNFVDTVDYLIDTFPKASVIRGGQSNQLRAEMIDDFQSGETDIMICQIRSGGVGASLHDLIGKPRVSIICPPDGVVDFVQALGRIWRAGSKSKALQQVVCTEDTIEENIFRNLRTKIKNINTINDGDFK